MQSRSTIEILLTQDPKFGDTDRIQLASVTATRSFTDSLSRTSPWSIANGQESRVVVDSESASTWPGLNEAFTEFAKSDFNGSSIRLARIGQSELDNLSFGLQLLTAALPTVGPDVWRHVHAVSIVDSHGLFRSTTLHNLIGVVFIDRTELTTTCATAEALLHEGLHAKFDAIHRANPLTAALSSSSQSRVLAVWHSTNGDREWSVMRALAAFHVYAHLVFLADALINLGDTRDYGSRLYTRSLFRAHYLGNEILRTDADLTETGHDFIRWLLDLLPDSDGLSPNQRHLIRQGIPRLRS